MKSEEEILRLFDNYFENAPIEEINKDLSYINNIGFDGVTFEEYVSILNNDTSYNLKEAGICDDIAFSDLFNHLINPIFMGNNRINDIIQCIKISYPEEKMFASNVPLPLAA
jgi:hypothetical protein